MLRWNEEFMKKDEVKQCGYNNGSVVIGTLKSSGLVDSVREEIHEKLVARTFQE